MGKGATPGQRGHPAGVCGQRVDYLIRAGQGGAVLPFLAAFAATQEGVILAEQAFEAGLTAEEVKPSAAAEHLDAHPSWCLRRNRPMGGCEPESRHRLLVRATLLIGDRSAVVCDRSAVAWYGLDTLTGPPPKGARAGAPCFGRSQQPPRDPPWG